MSNWRKSCWASWKWRAWLLTSRERDARKLIATHVSNLLQSRYFSTTPRSDCKGLVNVTVTPDWAGRPQGEKVCELMALAPACDKNAVVAWPSNPQRSVPPVMVSECLKYWLIWCLQPSFIQESGGKTKWSFWVQIPSEARIRTGTLWVPLTWSLKVVLGWSSPCPHSRALLSKQGSCSYIHPLRGPKPYTIYSTEDNGLLSQEFIRYSALSCLLISLSRKNASDEEQESCNAKGIPLRATTCKPRLLLRPAWCLRPGVHLCLTVGTATRTRTRIP